RPLSRIFSPTLIFIRLAMAHSLPSDEGDGSGVAKSVAVVHFDDAPDHHRAYLGRANERAGKETLQFTNCRSVGERKELSHQQNVARREQRATISLNLLNDAEFRLSLELIAINQNEAPTGRGARLGSDIELAPVLAIRPELAQIILDFDNLTSTGV